MKIKTLVRKNSLMVFVITVFFSGIMCTQQKDTSDKVKNPYFAQTPPGDTAEIFAKDIISIKGRFEFGVSFSPDGKQFVYGVVLNDTSYAIMYTHETKEGWSTPKRISLSEGKRRNEMEASFSPDGKHIYFAPYNDGMDVGIWKVDITAEGWRNPQPLDSLINSGPAFYPVCTNSKTLYYTNIIERKIYKAEYKNGKYDSTQEAGFPFGMHCFIVPDESYALIDGRDESSIGKGDIYVVFKNTEGEWNEPINLGSRVNSTYSESCPALSHDGKYIFFSRYNDENGMSDIYWVDVKVIEQFR